MQNQIRESEMILLGSWLQEENLYHVKDFNSWDFTYFPQIFRLIDDYLKHGKPIEPLSIGNHAKISVSEMTDIITAYMPIFYSGAYYAIKRYRVQRLVNNLPKEKSLNDAVSSLMEEIDSMNVIPEAKAMDWALAYADELQRRATEEPMSYGLGLIDYYTGGLRRNELTVIAARPSVGKSAFALQIARAVAKQKKRVFLYPLEMSVLQVVERIVCNGTKIPHEKLKHGDLTDSEWKMLSVFADEMQKIQKYLFMPDKPMENLSEIRTQVKMESPDLVIIDQLSLLDDKMTFPSTREKFSYMTHNLKQMCMKLNVPIILLAQINRDAKNSIPAMENLKESGSIEEDSDNVIILHNLDEEQVEESGAYKSIDTSNVRPTLIRIDKQRNGVTGDVYTVFKGNKFEFAEV